MKFEKLIGVRFLNETCLADAARPMIKSSGYRAAPHQWGFDLAKGDISPIHQALLRSWATSSPSGGRLRSDARLPD
jgi:hypothetical protein